MKKIIYLFCFILVNLNLANSQVTGFSVSPQSQCYTPGGNMGYVGITGTFTTATSYSWIINSPSGCAASYSLNSSNGGFLSIYYPCCGVYTINCYAYNGNTLLGVTAQTAGVVCPSTTLTVTGNTNICAGYNDSLHVSGGSSYTWQPGNFTGSSIVVSPTVSTCYTVTNTGSTTCGNSAQFCVNVQPSGTVNISGPNSICVGGYATLSASGANSYTWLPGGSNATSIVVSPTASTCYTLIGHNNCSGYTYAVKCLSVTTAPALSVSGNTNVCFGQTTTITVSGASNYTWYPNYGAGSSIVLTPTTTTCFSVIGSNGSGCNSYLNFCVNVNSSSTIGVSGSSTVCAGSSATLTASGQSTYTWQPGSFTGSVVVVSPSVNTCYTVSGSSGSGCSATAVKCVSVQSSGNVSVSGPSVMCSNSNAYLYAYGASNYTWYPGGSTGSYLNVMPGVSTCYTLVGQGCGGLSSAIHCMSVTPAPTISIVGNTSVCAGSSTTLSANGAVNYTWMTSSGNFTGTSIVLTPTASTCFSLYGVFSPTANNSCGTYTGVCISTNNSSGTISISGNSNLCPGFGSTTLTASGASNYTWMPGNITGTIVVLSPSVSTCYTAYGYNSNNCIIQAIRCVNLYNNPTVTVNQSSGIICNGSSVTLYASGAFTYTWLPWGVMGASLSITPSVSTCYTVLGGATCTGSTTNCFSVMPSPTVTVSGNAFVCGGSSTTLTASGASSYVWYPGNLSGSSIVVSPSVSTCYTLAGTQYSCTSYAVKCVTVQNAPSITTSGSNGTICAGNTSTIFANGANSYTWYPGSITGAVIAVSPSVSTCYTVVGSTSAGCMNSGLICIQVNAKPTISVAGGAFCAGSTVSLVASGANTYVWQPGNLSGSSIAVSPSVNTCYTVTGTNSNGCSNTAVKCTSLITTSTLTTAGTNTMCSGTYANIYVSGASSYTWLPGNMSGPNITVSPSVSTCYTVLGYNSGNGCLSSAVKCISVSASPVINISGNNILCAGTGVNLLASGANTYTWNTGSSSPFITVSPSVSSCYTVIGSNAQGCTASAVKCLSVQTSPQVNITGPSYICYGSSANLSASGAYYYQWSTGSTNSVVNVSPSSSSVYTVSGSNGICSVTKAFTLSVIPRPTLSAWASDSILCAGSHATVNVTGANTYTWSNGLNTSAGIVSPSVTTTYTVSGTNNYGCSNSTHLTIFVTACTGIAKEVTFSDLNIYPNPVRDQLHLQNTGATEMNFEIYDLLGRKIMSGVLKDTQTIDLSSHANGTYILKIESDNKSTYHKLILEK